MNATDLMLEWDAYFAAALAGPGPHPPAPGLPSPPFAAAAFGKGLLQPHLSPWYKSFKRPAEIQSDHIPEPVLGNPFSPSLRAIFLHMNPGGALLTNVQQFTNKARFGSVISATSYSAWAKPFPYLATPMGRGTQFWKNMSRGAGSILRDPLKQPEPCAPGVPLKADELLGIELWPWHSVTWRGLNPIPVKEIQECVLEPLATIVTGGAEKERDIVVFAVGAVFNTVLPLLGFTVAVPCINLPAAKTPRTVTVYQSSPRLPGARFRVVVIKPVAVNRLPACDSKDVEVLAGMYRAGAFTDPS